MPRTILPPAPNQQEALLYLALLEKQGWEPEAYLTHNWQQIILGTSRGKDGARTIAQNAASCGHTLHIVVNRMAGGLPATPRRVQVYFRPPLQRRSPECQYLKDLAAERGPFASLHAVALPTNGVNLPPEKDVVLSRFMRRKGLAGPSIDAESIAGKQEDASPILAG